MIKIILVKYRFIGLVFERGKEKRVDKGLLDAIKMIFSPLITVKTKLLPKMSAEKFLSSRSLRRDNLL